MSKAKRTFFVMMIVVTMLAMLPMTALAGSNSKNGIVLNFPNNQLTCKPDGTISWTGTGGQSVGYFFFLYDNTTHTMIPLGSGSAVGDGSVEFPYPALGGTMEFVVTIVVGTTKISGQWKVTCEPPSGDEGCTPGYWRNHFEDWPPTGYAPFDIFSAVFGVGYFGASYTLGDAIWQGGGGLNRLARHGTAALLSAAHPDVNYPYSVVQVISWVQLGAADPLAQANELGCSIP